MPGPDKLTRATRLALRRALEASRKSRGNADECNRLLVVWSRQDTSLRDALVRVACHRLARECSYQDQPRPRGRSGRSRMRAG